MLFQEASINDAVRLGMYETDPVHGIRQMMARIGRQLEADRIVLAEEQGDFLHLTYRWNAEGILPLDGEPLGYIEAINPSDQKFHYASDLLASLTRFFAILLRNRDMMKRLDRLSKSDQLTGLLERLQAHFETAKISIALGCTTAATPIDNIEDVLKQADALMYRQKLEQHRQKNEF